jgi:hypothetical protein
MYKYKSEFGLLGINQDCLVMSTFRYLKFAEKKGCRTNAETDRDRRTESLFTGFL